MAKKSAKRDPNLRAATVARVNDLLKQGLTKSGAFDRIAAESGRAKDAVQMLYYRGVRDLKKSGKASAAPKAAPKPVAKPAVAAKPAAAKKAVAAKPAKKAVKRSAPAAAKATGSDLPRLMGAVASAINGLLAHVEKTVKENGMLREQAQRFAAVANLVRGK